MTFEEAVLESEEWDEDDLFYHFGIEMVEKQCLDCIHSEKCPVWNDHITYETVVECRYYDTGVPE